MSFNYLEVAKVAAIVKEELGPNKLASIELVEFKLPMPIGDLNLAFIFESRQALVFSLKTPWTGVYFLPISFFKPTNQTWSSAFGSGPDFRRELAGLGLISCSVPENERVFTLTFEGGKQVSFELFPARPNWVFEDPSRELKKGWKRAEEGKPLAAKARLAPPAGAFQVREFSGDGSWMERAYIHYLKLRQKNYFQTRLQQALAQVQIKMGRLVNARSQMREAQGEVAGLSKIQKQAVVLKQNLHELKTSAKVDKVVCKDAETGADIVINLDRRYSIADNLTQLFSKVKKLERTKKEVQARMGALEDEIRSNSDCVQKLKAFQFAENEEFEEANIRWLKLLKDLKLEVAQSGDKTADKKEKPPSKAEKKWTESGLRRFQSKEGFAIWVGRNHKENEELVIRLAKGNDLWLHLKGKPGAHVVVQLPAGKAPPLETMLDAAQLVAYFSGVKEGDKVEVDYTFRKYVKRVATKSRNGSPQFLVTYSQNKTLMIKLEESRLWRILKSI